MEAIEPSVRSSSIQISSNSCNQFLQGFIRFKRLNAGGVDYLLFPLELADNPKIDLPQTFLARPAATQHVVFPILPERTQRTRH